MANKSLYVTLRAQPGKEEQLARFLTEGLKIAEREPDTVAWFAIRLNTDTFAIFDAFPDDSARQAHLNGQLASALTAKGPELLAEPPQLRKADVLAAKLPHLRSAAIPASREETIPMQVGSELRIRNSGELVVDNPEIELAENENAADAILAYRYNRTAGEHTLRLLEPIADRRHIKDHKPND